MISYDVTPLGASNVTTEAEIIQLLIYRVAELEKALAPISEVLINNSLDTTVKSYVGNALRTQVTTPIRQGLSSKGSGESTVLSIDSLVPPRTACWYWGDLSVFDSTGKGLASAGYAGWYQMNGLNNTMDLRGFVPIGATNLPGPTLDPIATGGDPAYSITMGQKIGTPKVGLSTDELPTHTHEVDDPGHTHGSEEVGRIPVGSSSGTVQIYPLQTFTGSESGPKIDTTKQTGVKLGSVGKNIAHENRQPCIGGCWITKLD